MGGCLFLLALTGASGLLLACRHLRAITQRQVNFDRCVGASAIRLRRQLLQHESSWRRIRLARALTWSQLPTPNAALALESFRLILLRERVLQEGIRGGWIRESLRWNTLTGLGCGLRRRPARSPYPAFELPLVETDPQIELARTLENTPPPPPHYRLDLGAGTLKSGVFLRRWNHERWSIQWDR